MIKVENVSHSFPDKDLYNKVSFTIEAGQHCAFIGASGTGKSTLIEMIMDREKYLYDGKIIIEEPCRIGYVSQFSHMEKTEEVTVFQYIGEKFIKLQNEITSICTEMETASDIEPLLEKYQETLDAFQAIDGDNFESNISKKLYLANLSKHEDQYISKLSGGEFKLIQVIKEQLTSPDLLIMDEPDVFLDFENINGLKNLINAHQGAILVITHNRYLLNHCFNKILHLENADLQEFEGNFMEYNLSLLLRKIELQEMAHADTEEIQRNSEMVERLRERATFSDNATMGRALKSRVAYLARLEARRIKEPFVDIKEPHISLSSQNPLEDTTILKVEDYSVAFKENLLQHVSFEMGSKDKVALIGPNGTGKTTLLRDIYKNNNPAIEIHEEAKVAFLSQLYGEMLDEDNTIQQEFLEAGFNTYTEIAAHLSQYGFKQEILTQKIGSLSGGEKNLLQLAKIQNSESNFLLLDEPTSHLDTYAQMALENAIKKYNGAILMVSHDFYTIANCVDYVLLIENNTIRRMSNRKFRQMIYKNHFNKDYLEIEQKKKETETKIAYALQDNDFEQAKVYAEKLEEMINALGK